MAPEGSLRSHLRAVGWGTGDGDFLRPTMNVRRPRTTREVTWVTHLHGLVRRPYSVIGLQNSQLGFENQILS